MRTSNYAKLIPLSDGNLQFSFSYNSSLIAALKSEVPYTDRTWEPNKKVWIVAPKHSKKLVELVAQYLGLQVQQPILSNQVSKLRTEILKIEYLGAAKDRGNGEITATGYCNGSWSVIFPVDTLKAWFDPDGQERPSEAITLYTVLGLSRKADQEEIKKSYRRLAKQWHPDVCREPDAVQQFQRLQNAYEVLSDETKRKKYNAGLKLEASLAHKNYIWIEPNYRAPLRCGYVLAEVEQVLNRFVVKKILGWEDITQNGLTMVSSWQAGDDHFTIEWS